jgi:hypothetical protein
MATVPATVADAIRQIRTAIKILGVLEAKGEIDRREVQTADATIEAGLMVIERLLDGPEPMPVLTLAEVAARAKARPKPELTCISGDRA